MLSAEEVIPQQLDAIEVKRATEVERHAERMAWLEELKSKLLAITHQPEQSDE